ncbi:hypothetical protein [Cupriavidus sp. TMH.W2]|uniref:hypothetical protein n=1 Tax=Cupriavidus sp. TMH.W2 TaxID=3434465 RepID=UPI003D78334F
MVIGSVTLSADQAATLAYLGPPAVGALFLRAISGRFATFALATLVGTIVHETLHLVLGAMTGARPVSMNLFPRKSPDGRMVMGSVTFENLRWYNAAPACLAPLIGFPLMVWIAWLRAHEDWHFQLIDLAIWGALAPQFISSWPSSTDLRLSLISWPIYLAAGIGAWVTWFPYP